MGDKPAGEFGRPEVQEPTEGTADLVAFWKGRAERAEAKLRRRPKTAEALCAGCGHEFFHHWTFKHEPRGCASCSCKGFAAEPPEDGNFVFKDCTMEPPMDRYHNVEVPPDQDFCPHAARVKELEADKAKLMDRAVELACAWEAIGLREEDMHEAGTPAPTTLAGRIRDLKALVEKQRESAQVLFNRSVHDALKLLTDVLEETSMVVPEGRIGTLNRCRNAVDMGRKLLAITAPTGKA